MIPVRFPPGQNLTDEAQPAGSVEPCNLHRRLMQGTQIDLCGFEAARSDALQKDLQWIVPHFPFRFAKNQLQDGSPVLLDVFSKSMCFELSSLYL